MQFNAYREDSGRRWSAALILALALFFVLPSFVFENNASEINLDFGELSLFAVPAAAVATVILYALMSIASRWAGLAFIVAGLGLVVAVKTLFLPTYVPLLDGTETFAELKSISGAMSIVSMIVVGALCIAAARYLSNGALRLIAAVLLLVGLQPLLQAEHWSLTIPSTEMTKSEFVDFSKAGDVLLVVLDTVQSDVALEVMEDNPQLAAQWTGFEYFWNHVGKSPTTLMSMLPIYSGKEYAGGSIRAQYRSLKDDSVFSDARSAGYDVQFMGLWFFECYVQKCLNTALLLPQSQLEAGMVEYVKLIELGLLRVLPTPVHRWWYNNSKGQLRDLVSNRPSAFQLLSAAALKAIATDLKPIDAPPRLKVLHIMGAHPPIVLNENCSMIGFRKPTRANYKSVVACSIIRFTRVLEALKRAGVYDQTTIVVMADHGETIEPPPDPKRKIFGQAPSMGKRHGRFGPMFAVKLKGATHPFELSSAPTATSDLRATLCAEVFKCQGEVPGTDVFKLDPAQPRERSFIDFRMFQTDHKALDGMPPEAYVRFTVPGLLHDSDYDETRVPPRLRASAKK